MSLYYRVKVAIGRAGGGVHLVGQQGDRKATGSVEITRNPGCFRHMEAGGEDGEDEESEEYEEGEDELRLHTLLNHPELRFRTSTGKHRVPSRAQEADGTISVSREVSKESIAAAS